jgi:hypothetical protein
MRGTGNRKKKPPLYDKEQSDRFVETAKKVEVDESGKAFKRAMQSLPHQRQKRDRP